MATKTTKKLADFRAVHDKNFVVPERIKAGLARLGKDGWEYEASFIRLCETNVVDFSRFRDQFNEYCVVFKENGKERRVWAGSKAAADKMREMI
jgi:hypothetical protein